MVTAGELERVEAIYYGSRGIFTATGCEHGSEYKSPFVITV
jgi:hypothetical protein